MTQPPHYPPGTVRALLETNHVSNRTREVLTERMSQQPGPLRFFTPAEAGTLQRIAARLIPQPPEAGYVVDLVGPIDERLANKEGDGWRYDALPADSEAFRQGIRGFQESAQALYGQLFDELTGDQQDELITQVQQGLAPGEIWWQLPPKQFFEELLAELVVIFYSHPLVQEAFGYVGMADKPGWEKIGLNNLEHREPLQRISLP